MHHPHNGMPAGDLRDVSWEKSRYSNSQGTCVEFAKLPSGEVALRNSRDPDGPVLLYTPAEIEAMVRAAKEGQFDHFTQG